MAYLVLARKYRPRNFAEMVGQEHVVQALRHALQQQRLHHAWLFTGTRGVGKTTVSRILAKSLNCTGADGAGGITDSPCGQCPACQAIDGGRFADYIELDAASNRGVEEIQTLLEQAVYKPVQGRFKVFMIDEVHMLTTTAFNAMLKTLEEPPPYLKFVLATTDPQKVPVTVLSRCLQFNLRPMRAQTVAEHLGAVLAAEGIAAQPAALALLAQAARGSMRDALSLTDQAIAFGAGRVNEAEVRHMLGSADTESVAHILSAWARGDAAALFAQAEALRDQGSAPAAVLDALARALQRMAAWQTVPGLAAQAVRDGDALAAQLTPIAAQLVPDTVQFLYSLCLSGRAELALAPDEHDALLMLLLRPLAFAVIQAQDASNAADSSPKVINYAENVPIPPKPTPNPEQTKPTFSPRLPEAAAQPMPAQPTAAPAPSPAESAAPAAATAPEAIAPMASNAAITPETTANSPENAPIHAETTPNPEQTKPTFSPRLPEAAAQQVPAQPAAAPSSAQGNDVVETNGDFWCAIVQLLDERGHIRNLVQTLAVRSQLVRRSADGTWFLHIEQASMNHPRTRAQLLQALQMLLDNADSDPAVAQLLASPANLAASLPNFAKIPQNLELSAGPVTDSLALRQEQAAQARSARLHAAVDADPKVQLLKQQWGARVVPGSVVAVV